MCRTGYWTRNNTWNIAKRNLYEFIFHGGLPPAVVWSNMLLYVSHWHISMILLDRIQTDSWLVPVEILPGVAPIFEPSWSWQDCEEAWQARKSQWVQTKCLGRCHWCHGNLACLKFQLFCALPILPYPSYHPLAGAQPRAEEKGCLWTCFASFRACWMGGAGHFQRSGPCHCNEQPWLKFATFEIWEPGKMINFKVVLIAINWRLGQLASHSAKTPWRCVLVGKGRCRPWGEVELEAVCKTWGHAAELQASHKGHENKKLDPNISKSKGTLSNIFIAACCNQTAFPRGRFQLFVATLVSITQEPVAIYPLSCKNSHRQLRANVTAEGPN